MNLIKKEVFLITFFVIFFIISIYYYFYWNYFGYWLFSYFYYIVLTILIWLVISRKILEKNIKIPGRLFEYLFFIFLFNSTYFSAFSLAKIYSEYMLLAVIVSIISAAYCGFLYYVNGIRGEYLKIKL
jgi:hypothetical protein